ncbi:MAG: DNA repair protein RecN [Pyrinomonadaceae bacterium]
MLQLLNLSNIALIDNLCVEFAGGLNLLTGETGSGKSIIVDALGVLIGGKFSSEFLKAGAASGFIEGLFSFGEHPEVTTLLERAGIQHRNADNDSPGKVCELIIRREVSVGERGRIFINHQLASQLLLRELREFLVDIHGQGDQQTLFNPATHLELLDAFADNDTLRGQIASTYRQVVELRQQLEALVQHEANKFQLLDTLKFQIEELERAQLVPGEDDQLDQELQKLKNVEKLMTLCQSSSARIYEDDDAALARVRQTALDISELALFEPSFTEHLEGLESARAVLEDLAFSLRNYADKLEASPGRLAEIEERLASLSRLKRKYGGSIEAALEHLANSQDKLSSIESEEEREAALKASLSSAEEFYLDVANKLHAQRSRAARKFERAVQQALAGLAMENGRFEVQILQRETVGGRRFGRTGTDHVEFYFSANAGEPLKPLAKVASGGEASRLMLVLKTVANASEFPRTIVFDEIDSGIGGRVSEAVGAKLKTLAQTNQVLCVTHQPQIARFADCHLVVRKEIAAKRTRVKIKTLDQAGRVEEIARMLTGAAITDSARKHATEMLRS